MKDLTAIIVTHNSADTLSGCISSLRANGVEKISIVDTESKDETLAIAKKSDVLWFEMPNRGFAAGCNMGAFKANTEYLLFLNPDAQLTAGALAHALSAMSADEKNGVVGLLLQTPQGKVELLGFGVEPTLWNLLARKTLQPTTYNLQPRAVDWVSGGAMLVRRKAFEQVGGFDEGFFMYWEDIDLCKRLRERGWKIALASKAKATHLRGGSNNDIRLKTTQYDVSADRYFRKHYAKTICLFQQLLRRIYRLFSPSVQ